MDIIVYTGSHIDYPTNDPLGISGSIVKTMMNPYMNKQHILFTDNWYTSVELANHLQEKGVYTCGIIKGNRKYFPKFQNKPKKGSLELKKSGDLVAFQWTDKRSVKGVTNVFSSNDTKTLKTDYKTGEPIMKPEMIVEYTNNMRGVDRSDSYLSSCECIRKCVKWYIKLFFHLVDLTVYNSYMMWKVHKGETMKYEQFQYNLCYRILQKYGTVISGNRGKRYPNPPDRCLQSDYIMRHHLKDTEKIQRNDGTWRKNQLACFVCKNRKSIPPKERKVTTKCHECNIPLCLENCFRDYHSIQNIDSW